MRILLGLADEARLHALGEALENRDERTRCTLCDSGPEVLSRLSREPYDLMVLDSVLKELDGRSVLEQLLKSPLWHCPPVLLIGQSPYADGCMNRNLDQDALAALADEVFRRPVPLLYEATRAKREARAMELLYKMNMQRHLKGTEYLAAMIPLALSCPKYGSDFKFTLYPYAADRFHCSPSSVERCVRHAIETTFSHGRLAAIEGFFGQSYDPEKGKPTNREFVAMCQIHLKEEYAL